MSSRRMGVSADSLYRFLFYFLGMQITRARVRSWTAKQREAVDEWAGREYDYANDNPVRRLPRPRCMPLKCVYGVSTRWSVKKATPVIQEEE